MDYPTCLKCGYEEVGSYFEMGPSPEEIEHNDEWECPKCNTMHVYTSRTVLEFDMDIKMPEKDVHDILANPDLVSPETMAKAEKQSRIIPRE